jgi:hypothetical protein
MENLQLISEENYQALIDDFVSSPDKQLDIMLKFTELISLITPNYSESKIEYEIVLEKDLSEDRIQFLVNKYNLINKYNLYTNQIYEINIKSLVDINNWNDIISQLENTEYLQKEKDIDLRNIKAFNEYSPYAKSFCNFHLSLNINQYRSLFPLWEDPSEGFVDNGVHTDYKFLLKINKTIATDVNDYDDYCINTLIPKKELIESTYNTLIEIFKITVQE